MKAIRMHGYGASDVLRLEELEDPEPGAGEVRVRIGASALNHVDIDVREGTSRMDIELPHILGFETAGTIERVGAGVDGWRAGDRVVPYAYALRKRARALGGGYADRIVVPSDGLAKTPEALDDVAAAAVQLAFGTAWHMLHTRGGLAAGETVLISSVSAGVASAAVQVAHRAGATTIGTSSSPAKLERAAALGLDHGIDYTREDVAERVAEVTGGHGVDLAIEHVGGERFPEALKALAERGRLVTCGRTPARSSTSTSSRSSAPSSRSSDRAATASRSSGTSWRWRLAASWSRSSATPSRSPAPPRRWTGWRAVRSSGRWCWSPEVTDGRTRRAPPPRTGPGRPSARPAGASAGEVAHAALRSTRRRPGRARNARSPRRTSGTAGSS